MQQLGQYIVTLTACSLICGILMALVKEGPIRMLLRLVCSILLIVSAVSPLCTDLHDYSADIHFSDFSSDGADAAAFGLDQSQMEKHKLITQMLSEYILEKASSLGADITPKIVLDAEGTPKTIQLTGSWTVQSQRKLEEFLYMELGITKENQQWIG